MTCVLAGLQAVIYLLLLVLLTVLFFNVLGMIGYSKHPAIVGVEVNKQPDGEVHLHVSHHLVFTLRYVTLIAPVA